MSAIPQNTLPANYANSANRIRTIGTLGRPEWVFVGLAFFHALLLAAFPTAPVIALGVWWNSNTVAHNFLHRPFFRQPSRNAAFSLFQSLLLGIPQSVWRQRHLAHHAGREWRLAITPAVIYETGAVLVFWVVLLWQSRPFFLQVYLPGYGAGLLLCWLHGYFEHSKGTTNYHGRLYNRIFFNDGYHIEHHRYPGLPWWELPRRANPEQPVSRWPAVLRWLELRPLEFLERVVLLSPVLQRFVVQAHRQAFRKLLAGLDIRRVGIVGGGLFPRTALALRDVLPEAELTIIDASAENLRTAAGYLPPETVEVRGYYDPSKHAGFDLVVIPLCFVGNRESIYAAPPAPWVLVHDWLWKRRGATAVVSLLLLKRLNLCRGMTQIAQTDHEST